MLKYDPLRDNRILSRLTTDERRRLEPHMQEQALSLGTQLQDAADEDQRMYFPRSGILSLILSMEDGATGELAVIGNEGLVGISIFLSGKVAAGEAIVQVAGAALTLPTPVVQEEFNRGGNFQHLLLSFSQALFDQIAQTAICNRHHTIDQQLARWLLLCMDRVHAPDFFMTQEMMADMLGVRREGITLAAGKLRRENVIAYQRGKLHVLNREALLQASCECYRTIRDEYALLGFGGS